MISKLHNFVLQFAPQQCKKSKQLELQTNSITSEWKKNMGDVDRTENASKKS